MMSQPLEMLGKMLMVFGLVMLVVGGLMVFIARLWAGGGLPGDIVIRRPGMVVYIPITSAIIASILLSLILSLIALLRR